MRRLFLLLLVFLPLPVACGGGADSDAAVQRALTATRAARTADVTTRFHVTGLGTGALDVTARGSIDFAARRSAMSVSYGAQASVEERIVDGTLYVRSPQLSRGSGRVPPGNWLAVDLDQAAKATSLDLGPLQLGNDDPAQGVTFLAAAVPHTAQRFGHDTIGDTRTTHYRVKVDLTKVAASYAQRLGQSTVTVDAWVDDHDLVRRTVVPLPLPKEAGAVDATASTDYDHFGVAVVVEAPPPAQVTRYADLLDG